MPDGIDIGTPEQKSGKGRGPPENPGSRGKRFGSGEEYTCPDCGSPVTFLYNGEDEIPNGGWQNLILTSDEYMVIARAECEDCDWYSIKRIEVHEPTG